MRKIGIVLFLTLFGTVCAFSQQYNLDRAIQEAATSIIQRLATRSSKISVVAIFTFKVENVGLEYERYITNKLINHFANSDKIYIVNRRDIEEIMREWERYPMVNEATRKRLFNLTGADYVLTGSISLIGGRYTMDVKATHVESFIIGASWAGDVRLPRWTPSEKVGFGALNLIGGIGSFRMGDNIGGGFVLGGQVVGLVSFTIGILSLNEDKKNFERNYPGMTYEAYKNRRPDFYTQLDVAMYGGLALVGASALYGFVQPWIYDAVTSNTNWKRASFDPFTDIRIGIIPDNKGIGTMSLTYSRSF